MFNDTHPSQDTVKKNKDGYKKHMKKQNKQKYIFLTQD